MSAVGPWHKPPPPRLVQSTSTELWFCYVSWFWVLLPHGLCFERGRWCARGPIGRSQPGPFCRGRLPPTGSRCWRGPRCSTTGWCGTSSPCRGSSAVQAGLYKTTGDSRSVNYLGTRLRGFLSVKLLKQRFGTPFFVLFLPRLCPLLVQRKPPLPREVAILTNLSFSCHEIVIWDCAHSYPPWKVFAVVVLADFSGDNLLVWSSSVLFSIDCSCFKGEAWGCVMGRWVHTLQQVAGPTRGRRWRKWRSQSSDQPGATTSFSARCSPRQTPPWTPPTPRPWLSSAPLALVSESPTGMCWKG